MTRRPRLFKTLAAATIMLVGGLFACVPMAAAQSDTLTIPANTIVRGEPGDVVELGRIAVDTSLAGPLCTWSATATNQSSTHPGTDILVQSNGTTLVLADIEATPNKVTSNAGSVALATEVVVSVRLGPDGRFSGRLDLTISYSSCQSTTTTTIATTTSSTASSTTEPTTTTESTTLATTTTTLATTTTTDTVPAGPDVSQTDPTTTTTTAAPPTTAAPTTAAPTTPTTTSTAVLPVTGNDTTMPMVALGLGALGIGTVLTAVARRRNQ